MSCESILQFYAGEDQVLEVVLKTKDNNNCTEHYDLTGATAIKVTVPANPTDLEFNLPAVVVDEPILGKIHVDLTPANTNVMMSGPLIVDVTNAGGKKRRFIAEGAIRRLEINNC